MLKVPEAGALMGIGKSKAYQMAQRGEMPGLVRMGGSLRVHKKVLEDWIDKAAARPPAA